VQSSDANASRECGALSVAIAHAEPPMLSPDCRTRLLSAVGCRKARFACEGGANGCSDAGQGGFVAGHGIVIGIC